MAITHAAEKYGQGVRMMAVSHGSLQERLRDAFRSKVCSVNAERDLPPVLRVDHNELLAYVTRFPGLDGSIAATCEQLTDEEASEVAERVLNLEYRIRSLFDIPMGNPRGGKPVLTDVEAMVLAEDPYEDEDRPSTN